MPQQIEHIDAIARIKQRDVLYITFTPKGMGVFDRFKYDYDERPRQQYRFDKDPIRKKICLWLEEHNISWEPCGYIANECMMVGYEGQIYVDVPYDESDPCYMLLRDYLENPDGSMKFENVIFWLLPLEKAMQNKHHDEPGFWENWAENF